jgi:recombination protein RecR
MYDAIILDLVDKLSKLPGIGPKSATRLAFFIIESDATYVLDLANAILQAKEHVQFCVQCGNTSSDKLCQICANPNRDQSIICVVEETRDLVAIEKTHGFQGTYLVLGGALNPLAGIGVEDLRFGLLMKRLGNTEVQELIIATNPNIEGEATASYIGRFVKDFPVKLTRIALGLPMGGDLEYADEMTLGKAIETRRPFGDEAF